MTEEILSQQTGRIGHLSLNRSKALHALNLPMCEAMIVALQEWATDESIEAIILDHAEGRGFCAGGDIRMLAESGAKDGKDARAFFHTEYQLNHMMFEYEKPIVAFMDGITMGGGVGISMPAQFRVASENTRFAMPETGIGLFPDVGGGWFLPRLEGRVGQYLALTGARIDGAECTELGIATHYVPSENLEEAKERIAQNPDRIGGILGDLSATPPEAKIVEHIDRINRHFASDRYEDILEALENAESDWAHQTRGTLGTKSPQTCKVALRQLKEGLEMSNFAAQMKQEYAIGARVVQMHDFIEGVRAVIIDKDHEPKWNPAIPEDMTEAMLDHIFAPLPDNEEWKPLV